MATKSKKPTHVQVKVDSVAVPFVTSIGTKNVKFGEVIDVLDLKPDFRERLLDGDDHAQSLFDPIYGEVDAEKAAAADERDEREKELEAIRKRSAEEANKAAEARAKEMADAKSGKKKPAAKAKTEDAEADTAAE